MGVWITSSEDFAPTGNHVVDNVWGENGVDVAMAASELVPGSGNCLESSSPLTTSPSGLTGCELTSAPFVQMPAPKGLIFSRVPTPPQRPGLDGVDEVPRTLPAIVEMPSLEGIAPPSADLLGDAG